MAALPPDAAAPLLERARALRAGGRWAELAALAGDAEARAEGGPELAFLHALALRVTGRPAEALAALDALEPRLRLHGDRALLAAALVLRGIARWETGDAAGAEELFADTLERAAAWGDEETAARCCNNLGVLANVRGRRDLALAWYQRALAAYHRLGSVPGAAETHHNLGISYRDLGMDRDADGHFARAIALAEAERLEHILALAETERAALRVRWRDGALADRMAERALARFRRIADPTGAAGAIRVRAAAARVEGRDDRAAAALEEALEIARAHTDALLRAEVQRDRGDLLRDRGEAAAAREAYLDAALHFDRIGAAAEAEAVRAVAGGSAAGPS